MGSDPAEQRRVVEAGVLCYVRVVAHVRVVAILRAQSKRRVAEAGGPHLANILYRDDHRDMVTKRRIGSKKVAPPVG